MFRILVACLSMIVWLQLGCSLPANNGGNSPTPPAAIDSTYRPGDKILIDFADNPGIPPTWQQTVREDGTIGLPFNQVVLAAGKQKAQLEQAIHDIYVDKILKRLTVNIRAEQRFFYVTGEVKVPGPKEHTGSITVLRAVAAAGDFSDYADKGDIDVFRANGEVLKVNGKDALKDASKDVPVYPGDRVFVNRRFF